MATITIDTTNYTAYASVSDANKYLGGEFSDAAVRWRDATLTDDDAKGRALVSATRLLNRQLWPGEKTDGEDQTDAWPRTSTGISGLDEDTVPQDIIDASVLIAADINNGVNVTGSTTTDDRIRRQQAGSVSIEYFRDNDGGTRFPTAIQELLAPYLAGGSTMVSAVLASGTDAESDFAVGYAPVGSL